MQWTPRSRRRFNPGITGEGSLIRDVWHNQIVMYPRAIVLLAFALGMSTVGLIYLISGQWWPKWLMKGAELLTKRQSTLRAYGVIVLGIAIGIVCLLLPS